MTAWYSRAKSSLRAAISCSRVILSAPFVASPLRAALAIVACWTIIHSRVKNRAVFHAPRQTWCQPLLTSVGANHAMKQRRPLLTEGAQLPISARPPAWEAARRPGLGLLALLARRLPPWRRGGTKHLSNGGLSMRRMVLLASAFALVLVIQARAEDTAKGDASKLVGTWTVSNEESGGTRVSEDKLKGRQVKITRDTITCIGADGKNEMVCRY